LARTWPTSFGKRAALAVIDAVGYTLTGALRLVRRHPPDAPIRKILVIEPWQVGDVVLVTPLLAALKEKFPDASVSLLAKPYAAEILGASDLVDEIIGVDLPWTRATGKYRTSSNERGEIRKVIRELKAANYDLVLDARGDPRTHLVAALTGARTRVGYDLGGGWLLTHPLKAEPDKRHKIGDWLELLAPLGVDSTASRRPRLSAGADRIASARAALARSRADTRPVVAFHPGASHAGKRWPLERFAELSHLLRSRFGGSTIVFIEPGGYGEHAEWADGSLRVKSGLADLMAHLTCCDLLVCNDSGPMHLADALGVPLVAVFERGNPQWFGPSGMRSRVVWGENAGKGLSPIPVDDAPLNPVESSRVLESASQLLEESGFTARQGGE
jgi:ADP-heptose:LPS heptosyltransferase